MKSAGNHWRFIFVASFGLTLASITGPAIARNNLNTLEQFRFDLAPKNADWRYFLKAPAADRERLWAYHVKAGHSLGAWAWGWRLGWVRACGESADAFCVEVLHQALFDKALVVRAEAATRYGRRFENAAEGVKARAVSDLADAFRLKGNWRGKKPLFVTDRILFALHTLGGDQAMKAGARLAALDGETRAYWAKLTASD